MRAYRAMLRLCPASFRAEYGGEMLAVFVARRRQAHGLFAVAGLWIQSITDVVATAACVHADILRQDTRTTIRALRHAPGFAVAAILVAGLGVGATTAAFSLADHVLLRPLPFPDPDRLVRLWQDQTYRGYPRLELSPANYRDWAQMNTTLASIAAYRGLSVNLVGAGLPQRIDGASITASLLPTLGARAAIGRVFAASDDRDGAPGTVLLSARLWQSQFAADPNVVGRTITLDGAPYTIIGVMPPEFRFPDRTAVLWTAMRFGAPDFADRTNVFLQAIGRMKAGVTIEQVRADFSRVAQQLAHDYPENARTGATAIVLHDVVSQSSRIALLVMAGASACVLLIACSNLTSLLLARALGSRRELAVRAALGAGRERLVRQVLTESAVLAVAGGVLGTGIAFAAAPIVATLAPSALPIAAVPDLDARLLTLTTLVTILTGLGIGVIPALRASRASLDALGDGARAGTSRRTERLRSTLVTVQVAASVVLLVVSGLLLRALWRIENVDPGFRVEHLLTAQTSLPMPQYQVTTKRLAFYERVLSAVRAQPGVTSASYISFMPMTVRGGIFPVTLAGHAQDPTTSHVASIRYVTPGFFETLGVPVRAGRDVRDADTAQAPWVAVVSESFAAENWPGESALGRRFDIAFHEREVVGIVGDIAVRGLGRVSEPQVYMPAAQIPDGMLTWFAPKDLVVNASIPPAGLESAIRRIVRDADPDQPVSNVQTLEDLVAADTSTRTIQARVLGAFAALACLLAGLGIHGLLTFAVSAREKEIGVRRALGAQPINILALVLGRSAALAGAGLVAGAVVAWIAGQSLRALLAGVDPADAATFSTAGAIALITAIAGSSVAAIRAIRINPLHAIRRD